MLQHDRIRAYTSPSPDFGLIEISGVVRIVLAQSCFLGRVALMQVPSTDP